MDYSFQLYSARNHPNMPEVLKKVAGLGYTQVEGFGGLYTDPAGLAAELKSIGLTMPTGHFGLDMLQDTSATMKIAETLGVKVLYCPAVGRDQRVQSDAGWVALGETLAALGETYTKAGFKFGWHNHAFEFAPTDSGKLPMDLILSTAPDIVWEVDVAWMIIGKNDPVAWLKKHGKRVNALHVKDIAPAGECVDEDGWADVGYGTMDWPGLMNLARTGTACQYYVMEHDNPSDVIRFATRSIDTLRKLEK